MSDTDSIYAKGARCVRSKVHLVLVLSALLFAAAEANADPNDSAGAEVLFREGKQLMDQHDYGAACPKLAESYRLDPATGSLLALALCYERAGKLASAWVAYTDAAAMAKREGQVDREQGAQARARELEPKLARLTVDVQTPQTPGLEVIRDGVHLGPAALGTALPVDPGEHVIEARAPGRVPFREVVEATGPDELTVLVPELGFTSTATAPEKTAVAAAATSDGARDPGPADEPDSSDGGSTLSTVGIIVAAVGTVGLAVGAVYGFRALSLKKQANCDKSCEGSAREKQQDAYDAGNVSTIAFVAGGVLAATGVTLYLVGAPDDAPAQAVANPAPVGGGLMLSGRF